MTDTLHEHISQDIAKSFRIFRHPIKHLNKKVPFHMAYIFFPLYDNPPPTSRQTNSKDKHPKNPERLLHIPDWKQAFHKVSLSPLVSYFLTSLFTTFYIPCAIDFIKSRFYLRAIFTVLLKTKLFCPKIEIKTIGIINRYRNINQSYHSDIQPYADLHKSGHLKQFLFG